MRAEPDLNGPVTRAGHGVPAAARATAPTPPPRLRSPDLFGDAVEIHIEHDTQVYRLRKTSLGKLILTK